MQHLLLFKVLLVHLIGHGALALRLFIIRRAGIPPPVGIVVSAVRPRIAKAQTSVTEAAIAKPAVTKAGTTKSIVQEGAIRNATIRKTAVRKTAICECALREGWSVTEAAPCAGARMYATGAVAATESPASAKTAATMTAAVLSPQGQRQKKCECRDRHSAAHNRIIRLSVDRGLWYPPLQTCEGMAYPLRRRSLREINNADHWQSYFFFFGLVCFADDFRAGFFAGFAAGLKGLGAAFAGLDFSGTFGCGFGGGGAGAETGAAAATEPFAFFPGFGPGFAAADAAGASAAALAARPRLGAGGGGGGGGANGFKNFNVSVRERSFPSNKSMNTSCASLGYSGSCGVISNSVISGNGIFCCTRRHLVR